MEDESPISQQSMRMMRSTIENSSQFSDEELTSASLAIGSLYSMMLEVPTFIPPREQITFFTNIVACFGMGPLINSGLLNPKAASKYLSSISSSANQKQTGIINQGELQQETDDDGELIVFANKKSNIN